MKRVTKKSCALILLFLMLLTFASPALADDTDLSPIISVDECAELGYYWIDIYYDEETQIDEIIPITNGEYISSYCVSFIKNDIPSGYIVVDSDRYASNNVTEFCFSGVGIYETLANNYNQDITKNISTKIIYSTGLFEYSIPIDNTLSNFYSSTNELLDRESVMAACEYVKGLWNDIKESQTASTSSRSANSDYVSFYDGFFTSGTITSEGSYVASTITNAASFTPSIMRTLRSSSDYTGNCGPTACANLLSYYKEKRGYSNLGESRQDIYDSIITGSGWNRCGTVGMTVSQASTGMRAVVTDAGYTYSSNSDYSWSAWTRDLSNNYPVLTLIRGYYQNTAGNWVEDGHFIVAIGYREYESGALYLRVWDGWNATSDKYIWFNGDYFHYMQGLCVKLSS